MYDDHNPTAELVTIYTVEELENELAALERGLHTSLSDDDLRGKLRLLHGGYQIHAPTLPAGTTFYRAVRVSRRPSHISHVSYPPKERVGKYGRLNRPGEVMFYGGFHPVTGLLECGCEVGEIFAVSGWITTAPMLFNHLGYSRELLARLKIERDIPGFVPPEDISVRNKMLRAWQARVFTQRIPAGQEHLYRMTVALKDFALGAVRQNDPSLPSLMSGVIYPSIPLHLTGDNVAILPSEVDKNLRLFEVALLALDSIHDRRVEDGTATGYGLKPYEFARPDADGTLIWGQTSQIFLPAGVNAATTKPQLLPPEVVDAPQQEL